MWYSNSKDIFLQHSLGTQGITFKHDCDIIKSVFIGDSRNLGEPNKVRLKNGTTVMWHRSTPQLNGGGKGGFIGK